MTLRIRIAHWLRRVAERLDPTPIDMWPVVPTMDDVAQTFDPDFLKGVK